MLGTAAVILLCLLPSRVDALTANATCRSGYEWMFSSTRQSPCDLTVELATVCYSTTFQVYSLRPGNLYPGPYQGYDTSCLCSSVVYSLLSACSYCQGGDILPWSSYSYNCTKVNVAVYPQQIPVGVKVPAYAYQDVLVDNRFNVSTASRVTGVESSRTLPSSTQTISVTRAAVVANAPASPATVGGVVGGILGIGLIAVLITFFVRRSKQKSQSQNLDSSIQQSPNMEVSPGTTAPLDHSSKSPSVMNDPYRQQAPPNPTPHFTGNGNTQILMTPQTMQQNTGGVRGYNGMPEL